MPIINTGRNIINSTLNSYSQVFFSTSKTLAVFLLVISFFDYGAGIGGLVAVVVANALAWGMGYNSWYLRSGMYGFNALLAGLGVGLYYQPSLQVFILVAVSALTCFFLTIVFQGVLGKYGLPFLSVPFLLTIWIVALSAGSLSALNLSERSIFVYNELYSIGGKAFVDFYTFLEKILGSSFIGIYFRSLGAIFFQTHLLAGILIAVGLLIYSRITFVLSILGYAVAWLFYHLVGIGFDSMGYTFIGFNYILTAIAIGGYYLVPGRASFGWIILLLPAVVLISTSTQQLFMQFRISAYSLPFNAIVLMFLYALKLREKRSRYLVETPVQMGKPENNLYLYSRNVKRFPIIYPVSAALPFYGEWTVNQGHNGEYTHKGDWRHAWDFVINDLHGQQYKNGGDFAEDYYCFGKTILAPADGTIAAVIENIPDNAIGDVNTKDNWGNTVIIKHSDSLHSKLSHLKYKSVEVKTGDNIKKGQMIGRCGNSGRSPYPHLHFQFQKNPYVGSATFDYPFGHYLLKEKSGFSLKSFGFPQTGQVLANPGKNEVLNKALHFIPGRRMFVKVKVESEKTKWKKIEGEFIWISETDVYNNSYMKCVRTGSILYLYNQGDMHSFTNYYGSRNSPLFLFFIALYKVPLGFRSNSRINDLLPVHLLFNGGLKILQDFVAPLALFLKAEYQLVMLKKDDDLLSDNVHMQSEVIRKAAGTVIDIIRSSISITATADIELTIETNEAKIKMVCRNEQES